MGEKRKYTKKSDYWKEFTTPEVAKVIDFTQAPPPQSAGEAYYVSDASMITASYTRSQDGAANTSSRTNGARVNRAALSTVTNRFSSIRMGMLPYEYASDGVNVRETIELCQKAYANVAVFRNAIDVMAEFANGDIYLEGGNKSSRDFFKKWFNKIRLWDLKDQYFREYYRSGNIFLYRLDGILSMEDFSTLSKIYASERLSAAGITKIPIKYVLLNPFSIVAKRATTFTLGAYEKVLSEYDLERLRNPKDEADQELFDSFSPVDKEKIKKGQFTPQGLLMKLKNENLSYSFYKKQDYEPFAIPFGYPVLEDINAKLELKKMDQAITRTVENVILLITMGAKPEDGGINAQNLVAMQQLFMNESVGRVLVSDYTTKAEFIIPDVSKVLGPEKYEVLNEDIRQGLQNVMIGSEKYNTTEIKTRIFMDRLNEARRAFLNDFLQREMKRVSEVLGFKSCPTARFVDMDSKDETEILRIATRLMELGIITPQEGLSVFNTGRFPDSEDVGSTQEEYVKERKKGFYNPLVGGTPMIAPPASKIPTGTSQQFQQQQNSTPKSAGRPAGGGKSANKQVKATYSQTSITEIVGKIEDLRKLAEKELRKKYKVKQLNEAQSKIVDNLCESIVCAAQIPAWEEKMKECVNDIQKLSSLGTLEEVLEVSAEHELVTYPAAVLFHSTRL